MSDEAPVDIFEEECNMESNSNDNIKNEPQSIVKLIEVEDDDGEEISLEEVELDFPEDHTIEIVDISQTQEGKMKNRKTDVSEQEHDDPTRIITALETASITVAGGLNDYMADINKIVYESQNVEQRSQIKVNLENTIQANKNTSVTPETPLTSPPKEPGTEQQKPPVSEWNLN